ncbi:MAG: IS1595 family transposase [Tannerellaceae bacterium]|jgi:transposase-like protein|nr:IS1595 family transposase [Tannerellaceae bacterium]
MKNREQYTGVNSIEFNRYFQSDEACYRYLASIKWSDENPYKCKKCGHIKYGKGKEPHSRRCAKCSYDESPTAGTMFDKIKFPILVAFHICFKISAKKKGMSSLELSEEFSLRQMTVWQFKWKIQQAMASSRQHKLNGLVHVDEFFVGEYEEGKTGRSTDSKKKLVIVALEIIDTKDRVGRAYAQVIERASSKEFLPFFEAYISKDAHVVTDVWKGYLPLKKDYPNLKQMPSDKGKNFPQVHIHIMNIQGWLRGIHHHCSKERLQGYLDEYHFRYNRRAFMGSIFDLLIERMVFNKPKRMYSNNL